MVPYLMERYHHTPWGGVCVGGGGGGKMCVWVGERCVCVVGGDVCVCIDAMWVYGCGKSVCIHRCVCVCLCVCVCACVCV